MFKVTFRKGGWRPPQFIVKYELLLQKKFIILNTIEIYNVAEGKLINIYLIGCYIIFARECNITIDCNITQQQVFLFAYSGQNIILCIFILTGHCK